MLNIGKKFLYKLVSIKLNHDDNYSFDQNHSQDIHLTENIKVQV